MPQVTAVSDVAAARDAYLADCGRYVPVVADGGIRKGGEITKALTVQAHKFSGKAAEKLAAAGGKAEAIAS